MDDLVLVMLADGLNIVGKTDEFSCYQQEKKQGFKNVVRNHASHSRLVSLRQA